MITIQGWLLFRVWLLCMCFYTLFLLYTALMHTYTIPMMYVHFDTVALVDTQCSHIVTVHTFCYRFFAALEFCEYLILQF